MSQCALRSAVNLRIDPNLPLDAGCQLWKDHETVVRHLRPLEPYLDDLPLVDDIDFWRFGDAAVEPHPEYKAFPIPWLTSQVSKATKVEWHAAKLQSERHAKDWKRRFDDLETQFSAVPKLREVDINVLEAIGDKTLIAEEIAKLAGYKNTSWFRAALSAMVARNLLVKSSKGFGYSRPRDVR